METSPMKALRQNFHKNGTVAWIGLRPERRAPLDVVERVEAIADHGLAGDRKAEKQGGDRQVTFIMGEHLDAIAAMLSKSAVDPGLTRRNIVTRGINLPALKEKKFRIGTALFELTKSCPPCSRMEENLGHGGYNAMREHGGWCARVLESGQFAVGDELVVVADS